MNIKKYITIETLKGYDIKIPPNLDHEVAAGQGLIIDIDWDKILIAISFVDSKLSLFLEEIPSSRNKIFLKTIFRPYILNKILNIVFNIT